MNSPAKPRLAIIGCGAVVEKYHLPALRMVGWTPTILVDRDVERVRHRFRHLKAGLVTNALDDHVDALDAAIVAVPNTLHMPICSTLLRRGKHVLVEKPMALTRQECLTMVEAARAGSARLAAMHWRRFRSVNMWTKALIDSGRLGEVQQFDLREGTVYGWPLATDASWHRESAGGGVLADMRPVVRPSLLRPGPVPKSQGVPPGLSTHLTLRR